MKIFKPEKNALIVLRGIIMLVSAVLIFLVKIYVPFDLMEIIIIIFIAATGIFMMFVYLPVYFSTLSYNMGAERITKHSGVFLKSHQSVKYSNVQYSTVVTTPFSERTGLNFIILFVYGGSLRLMFLSKDDAMEVLRRCGDVS